MQKRDYFDKFVFLNDDVIFVRNDWLDFFDEAYKQGADVVGPCVCKNHKGEQVPRCCFWSASSKFLSELPWPVSMSKKDAYEQEMNLLPSFMKQHGKKLFQVGNGNDLMYVKEYPPGKTGCIYANSKSLEICHCTI